MLHFSFLLLPIQLFSLPIPIELFFQLSPVLWLDLLAPFGLRNSSCWLVTLLAFVVHNVFCQRFLLSNFQLFQRFLLAM
jgi:hypothetical protein